MNLLATFFFKYSLYVSDYLLISRIMCIYLFLRNVGVSKTGQAQWPN
jgi:hypothetical protein